MQKDSCEHQGLADIKLHCSRDSHKSNLKSWKIQSTLSFKSSSSMNTHDKNVTKAEVKIVNFLVQHNLPLATADHLCPLFKDIFPDSKIISSYTCGRTETSDSLNKTVMQKVICRTANTTHLH